MSYPHPKAIKSLFINGTEAGSSFKSNIFIPFKVDEIQIKYFIIIEQNISLVSAISLLSSDLVGGQVLLASVNSGNDTSGSSSTTFAHTVFQMNGASINGEYTFRWNTLTGGSVIANFDRDISINMLFIQY
jgi:hypothetical protein